MVFKNVYTPALLTHQPLKHSPGITLLSRVLAAIRLLLNVGMVMGTGLSVLSGLPGSQEDLQEMGVSLGPTHS